MTERFWDGYEVVIQFIDEEIDTVRKVLESGVLPPHKREHYEGRLAAWTEARSRVREQQQEGRRADRRRFRLTIWSGDELMLSWDFAAGDEDQAVATAMIIAVGAGFVLDEGRSRPRVDGPAALGHMHAQQVAARISVEEVGA